MRTFADHGSLYTCGMHLFDRPDADPRDGDDAEIAAALRALGLYPVRVSDDVAREHGGEVVPPQRSMAPRPTPPTTPRASGPPSEGPWLDLDDAAIRARLARRDAADWPALLPELRRIASSTASAFRDVCSEEDALGELALRTHERWLADWLDDPSAAPLRVFLRDRLRDHLRELRRRHGRRAALLRGVVEDPSHPAVEHAEGPPGRALFASAPPRPDEVLEARELDRVAREAVSESAPLLALREAGFDQKEIAAHTGLSRPTVGRRLAAIAAVLAALTASGAIWMMVRQRPTPVVHLEAEPRGLPGPIELPPSASPWVHEATPLQAPTSAPGGPPSTSGAPLSPTHPPDRAPRDGETENDTLDAPTRDQRARLCLATGDHACVIALLEGRARSAAELAMLAHALRAARGVRAACPTIAELLDRFPASMESNRYRAVHLQHCQGR